MSEFEWCEVEGVSVSVNVSVSVRVRASESTKCCACQKTGGHIPALSKICCVSVFSIFCRKRAHPIKVDLNVFSSRIDIAAVLFAT